MVMVQEMAACGTNNFWVKVNLEASGGQRMGTAEEIRLLIKSKYPLIYLETADEEYSLNQLREAASSLGLVFYRWSATGRLRRGENQNSYYQTNEPAALFKTMLKLAGGQPWEPGLYVLKDIHHHLKNPVILRLCK